MIELRGVVFSYEGDRAAIRIPLLDIGPGVTLVVGPNGAGKSTLLRLIAGVDAPSEGTVTIDGHDLWREERAARSRLAFVPEYPELTPYARVFDVLQLVATLRGAPETTVIDALVRVGLLDVAPRTIREMSMGQRRRMMLATVFIGTPPVVILDEPLETLDAEMRAFLPGWVSELRSAGHSVLIATHDRAPFESLVDSVIVVQSGAATISPPREADHPDLPSS
jgi:ABC-2 type transport system ATP-binding protein